MFDLGSLFLLVAMVLWFTHEMVWGGKVPFFRDLGPYFYPMRFSLAESFRAGELPLWDRHVAMGFPLLANFQSGVFYPPHLFFLFLPFFGAIRALYVFHYLVAATGAYCLCRRWGYAPTLALIGGVLFTFGGFTVSTTNLLNHFQTAVWLPWVCLVGGAYLQSKSAKALFLFVLVVLFQFLAGSPEVFALAQGLFLLEMVRCKKADGNVTWHRAARLLLTAYGLVLGLGMIQLLPTLELFSLSARSESLPFARVAARSLHPLGAINFFFPDKEVDRSSLDGFRLFFSDEVPWVVSLYMGAIALPASLFWLINSSLKERFVLLPLVAFTLILAMGRHTPVFGLFYHYFPLFNLFRFPEKFLFLSYALVWYVVLRGLLNLLQTKDSYPRGFHFCLLAPGFLWLGLFLLLSIKRGALVEFINQAGVTTPRVDHIIENSAAILIYLERQISLAVGIFLVLFFWKKGKLGSGLSKSLLIGLVFFDLGLAHRPYQFQLDPAFVFEGKKVISAPDPEPNRLVFLPRHSYLHPNWYDFRNESFAKKISAIHEMLIPNTGILYKFDYLQELDALSRLPYNLVFIEGSNLPPKKLYRFLAVMNVKYLISAVTLPPGRIELMRHLPEYPLWLYKVGRVIPRAYLARTVGVEKDPLKVIERLSSSDFDSVNEVILDRSLLVPQKGHSSARVEILRYMNNSTTIRASLEGSGVLVLTDSFYPGWKVFVDGEEREILRANYFFRGVALSPGEHRIEFRYEPASFYYGGVVSLSALGLLFLIMVRMRKFQKMRAL